MRVRDSVEGVYRMVVGGLVELAREVGLFENADYRLAPVPVGAWVGASAGASSAGCKQGPCQSYVLGLGIRR